MSHVEWIDFFGEQNVLIKGYNDDVYFVIPNQRNEEGDSFTKIISKKAIIEMAEKIKKEKQR